MKPSILLALSASVLVAIPGSTAAHSGRTNSEGCHTNRSTGEYHCHGSRPAPTSQSPAPNGSWNVVSVGDGDTLRARSGSETATVRLACIDAPEMAQSPYGDIARNELQSLLPVGSNIQLNIVTTDRYRRKVAEVFSDGTNVNLALIQSGAAVAYRQYLSNCDATAYLGAEETARNQRLGFWNQANPVMPWDYRRQRR